MKSRSWDEKKKKREAATSWGEKQHNGFNQRKKLQE